MESKEIRENRADTTRVNSVIYADLLPYPTIYKFPLLVEKKKGGSIFPEVLFRTENHRG